MKNKTSLVLMEQLIMILVFSLAAALCLQAFALSDRISMNNQARDRAVLECQNAVEVLEHAGGDYRLACARLGGSWDGTCWEIPYSEQWLPDQDQPHYTLRVTPQESGDPLLGIADAGVYTPDGTCLIRLDAAWQEEVSPIG